MDIDRDSMAASINNYITLELITRNELLPLKNDVNLLDSGILDSLSLLRLVTFLEEKFGVVTDPQELLPSNFGSIDSICEFLVRKKRA